MPRPLRRNIVIGVWHILKWLLTWAACNMYSEKFGWICNCRILAAHWETDRLSLYSWVLLFDYFLSHASSYSPADFTLYQCSTLICDVTRNMSKITIWSLKLTMQSVYSWALNQFRFLLTWMHWMLQFMFKTTQQPVFHLYTEYEQLLSCS